MMRRDILPFTAGLLLLQGVGSNVQSQPAPFDMSPERPAQEQSVPQMPRPNPVAPGPVAPPQTQSAPAAQPTPPGQQDPSAADRGSAAPGALATATATGLRRYVLPAQSVALSGEYNRRAWSIYLTSEEAEAGRSVTLSYQSAIVVAPEASNLELFVNNRQIGQERINAPNSSKSVSWGIPSGGLRAGNNTIELVASQRHRTDCDIRSTYDLWTEIDGAGSYLQFAEHDRSASSPMEVVQSLGADAQGRTHFEMLVPSVGPMEELAPLLRLSQGLAVMNGMPNPQFSFQKEIPQSDGDPGRLTVVVGTASRLRELLPGLPAGAETGPVTTVMEIGNGGAPAIVVTGPTWAAVSSAIEGLIAPVLRSPTLRRESMTTEKWTRPNAPFVFGGERLTFAQLGIATAEFSGRRFRTGFDIAVPSDFYAGAYGEALIVLDAAYDETVSAGSHIDVYVNGDIASTAPIAGEGGAILRQLPIPVTMRHLRPGINRIELDAVLLSDQEACSPGSEAASTNRFALFDSSAFVMPSYARIGQTPNLAALSGTGFPHARDQQPTAYFMDRIDEDMLSAAANFLSKAAQVSGTPIPLEPLSAANAVGGRNAIFIGSAAQLPPIVLTQLNLDPNLAATWSPVDAAAPAGDSSASLEAWRDRLQGGFISQRWDTFRAWLQEKLDLSAGALRFLPGSEQTFRPGTQDDLIVAQGPGLNDQGIWTVFTAPNARELHLASVDIARQEVWQRVEGRIFGYSRATSETSVVEANRLSFLPPIDNSFANYRLIAANWLSSNLLSYGLVIVLVSCMLGMATAALLRWVGRQ